MPLWTTGTPLTNAAVAVTAIEQSSLVLWNEFLTGWFSGSSHTLNGALIAFPEVKLFFQEAALEQPETTPSITLTWLKSSRARRFLRSSARVEFLKTSWTFWIRAKGQNTGDGGPAYMVKRVSDLLYAVLANKQATLPLAKKGLRHVRPQNAALVTSTEYHMRSMVVGAELTYSAETG